MRRNQVGLNHLQVVLSHRNVGMPHEPLQAHYVAPGPQTQEREGAVLAENLVRGCSDGCRLTMHAGSRGAIH